MPVLNTTVASAMCYRSVGLDRVRTARGRWPGPGTAGALRTAPHPDWPVRRLTGHARRVLRLRYL